MEYFIFEIRILICGSCNDFKRACQMVTYFPWGLIFQILQYIGVTKYYTMDTVICLLKAHPLIKAPLWFQDPLYSPQ